jgi:serine/threonine-protein kinase
MLEVDGGRVLARDNDSESGIFVNGSQVKQQELHTGDVIRVGNSYLRLEDGAAAAEEEAEAEPEPAPEVVPAPVPGGLPRLPRERLGELADHTLSHYEIGPLLGRGHYGVVFRARDKKVGHVVALKVLAADFPKDSTEMQPFVQAMKAVLGLRHAHLVALLNAGRTPPYCWLALEYVEGESLAQVLGRAAAGTKLNWKNALRLGVHLGRALEFLHGRRIIHGNITPQNIVIRLSDKTVKLGDLMLDKALEGSALQAATLEAKLLAELPYMAPEQVDPKAYEDNLSDIYSLGAVVYARLTGQPPYQGESPEETIGKIQKGSFVRPRRLQPSVPQVFEAAVVRMLARRQEERYQKAADVIADLERIAEQEEVAV